MERSAVELMEPEIMASPDTKETEASVPLKEIDNYDFNIRKTKAKQTKEEKRLKEQAYNLKRKQEKKLNLEKDEAIKREHAFKTMNYLLRKSKLYSEYLSDKLITDSNQNEIKRAKLEEEAPKKLNGKKTRGSERATSVDATYKYFTGGTLRDYQLEGLNWLKVLYENDINGILADEMGLGKTIQVIAFIAHLVEKEVPGPFLIVAPLSTITNWKLEFKRFAPKIPVIVFHGSKPEREEQSKHLNDIHIVDGMRVRPVVITTYQIPTMSNALQRISWCYLILDEAQNIKNDMSRRNQTLTALKSQNRLLLTGTPLQNNMKELWALLNFLMPSIFASSEAFTSLFELEDLQNADKMVETEKSTQIISTVHGVLAPFMLRRLKNDVLKDIVPKKEVLVYCPLTELQMKLYSYIIEKKMDLLMGKKEETVIDLNSPRPKRSCTVNRSDGFFARMCSSSSTTADEEASDDDETEDDLLQYFNELVEYKEAPAIAKAKELKIQKDEAGKNIFRNCQMAQPQMALRKVANHPFLVHCPFGFDDKGNRVIQVSEELVTQSGKMLILDVLLKELKRRGHKILLFSCFTMMLDMIEELMIMRNYKFSRLDGNMDLRKRDIAIDDFKANKDNFVFLISTRAGGLGLNLVDADTVIFFDLDWNPQVNIQAQDRCHRIGQLRPVVIYKFICKGSIDETIHGCGNNKRLLEKIIIKRNGQTADDKKLLEILHELLKSVDHNMIVNSKSNILSKEEVEKLLDRTDLYEEMAARAKRNSN